MALAGVLTSLRITGGSLKNSRILFVGAGQAACGIADLIALAIQSAEGLSFAEACEKIFMVDVDGLLVEGRAEGDFVGPKACFVKKNLRASKDLADIIGQCRPSVLIGATGYCIFIFFLYNQ